MECCPSRDPLELDRSIELVDRVPRVTTANPTLQGLEASIIVEEIVRLYLYRTHNADTLRES